jgi:alanine racemase
VNLPLSEREHRAWVTVDLTALVENARTVARVAGVRLLPVVKANGYGLGARAAARALEALDPWGYGVATVEEGAELRADGITRPLLVFSPAQPQLFAAFDEHRLTPVFEDAAAIREWTARGARPFQVEIDTGMARTGVRWDAIATLREVLDTPSFEGCFTQFHSADRDVASVREQAERFQRSVATLSRPPAIRHMANSAAALRGAVFAADLVRPGLFLYGGAPAVDVPAGRAVMKLQARVVSIRQLQAGDQVSYNATWTAPRPTTVATLGIGYADGPRRALSRAAGAHVLLNGKRCPYVGTVTMDLTMVDVGTASVQIGDVATLVGTVEGGTISLPQFAGWCEDAQYTVLTGLGPRLPRVYVG